MPGTKLGFHNFLDPSGSFFPTHLDLTNCNQYIFKVVFWVLKKEEKVQCDESFSLEIGSGSLSQK